MRELRTSIRADVTGAWSPPVSLLRPIRDTWTTSVGVARERLRVGGRRRIFLDWVVQAAVLLLVGNVVPGILVSSLGAALFAAVVLGLLNALVRPVIILLTLPLNVRDRRASSRSSSTR